MSTHTRLRKFNTRDTYPEQSLDNDLCQVVRAGNLVFVRGQVGSDFDAKLCLGVTDLPKSEIVRMLSEALARDLEYRKLVVQSSLLCGALEATSSSVLLFGDEGDILFANPSADTLLSRQTEDDLLASCQGKPRQPLFTLLTSLVDGVLSSDRSVPGWTGAVVATDQLVPARPFYREGHTAELLGGREVLAASLPGVGVCLPLVEHPFRLFVAGRFHLVQ